MLKRLVLLAFFCTGWQPALAAAPAADRAALVPDDYRVAVIAQRIARANLDICPRTMPLTGLLVHAIEQYPEATRAEISAAFGLDAEPAVLIVVPGSAAARAGLQTGDRIVSIAGRAFPPLRRQSEGGYARIRQVEDHLLASLAAGPVSVETIRDGRRRSAMLEPEPGCLSRVQIVPSRQRKASADGTYAKISRGIIEFIRSEDELALVVAHEMAHNILGHRVRLKGQKVSRGLLKTFDGSAGKIKVTEEEADYLALYLIARAGFDVNAAPGFWKRFAPGGVLEIFSDGTHPARGSRVAAAERAIGEIRLKQQQGRPLTPELPLR